MPPQNEHSRIYPRTISAPCAHLLDPEIEDRFNHRLTQINTDESRTEIRTNPDSINRLVEKIFSDLCSSVVNSPGPRFVLNYGLRPCRVRMGATKGDVAGAEFRVRVQPPFRIAARQSARSSIDRSSRIVHSVFNTRAFAGALGNYPQTGRHVRSADSRGGSRAEHS